MRHCWRSISKILNSGGNILCKFHLTVFTQCLNCLISVVPVPLNGYSIITAKIITWRSIPKSQHPCWKGSQQDLKIKIKFGTRCKLPDPLFEIFCLTRILPWHVCFFVACLRDKGFEIAMTNTTIIIIISRKKWRTYHVNWEKSVPLSSQDKMSLYHLSWPPDLPMIDFRLLVGQCLYSVTLTPLHWYCYAWGLCPLLS